MHVHLSQIWAVALCPLVCGSTEAAEQLEQNRRPTVGTSDQMEAIAI